jgi:hypothetical protein
MVKVLEMIEKNTLSAEDEALGAGKVELPSIPLKRQVTVKSLVNEGFRQKARTELSDELKLIESQLEQLENQYQATLRQIENLAKTGQNVTKQFEQLNMDAQEKRAQLNNVKMQVSTNITNLDRVQNGDLVVTGVLENYVDIRVGDNIYDKLRGAEVIIEDGVVKSILG